MTGEGQNGVWPGDRIVGENGHEFEIQRLVAYRGKEGCTDPRCTHLNRPDATGCFGWHCSLCDAPCSSQGHFNCPRKEEIHVGD